MARKPGMGRGTNSVARGIQWCPIFFLFLLPDQRLHNVHNMCVYSHIWLRTDCTWITVATQWQCSWTFLHKSRTVRSVDWISINGATAWRICDIGQNVEQSSFQTGRSSSPSYCHIFFLTANLQEAFIRKIIILCINYKI